jgi:phosphoribosylformimino-5-aminoimidazole carboxamide ribotide isomerase
MNRRNPRLIPVLDIMDGQVVRAIGGRRKEYLPLISKLVQSTDAQAVARALLEATGATELYVADLDAIIGHPKSSSAAITPEVLKLLQSSSMPVWLDGGFGPDRDLRCLPDLPGLRPVIGLETCRTPDYLAKVISESGQRCIAFSIDLRDGELIGDWRAWGLRSERDSLGLARTVVRMGCRHLIVLDLTRVGTGSGCGTEDLLRAIRTEFPEVELIAGGGAKNWEDIDHLDECGADAVLVASAIHDGRITFPRPVLP